MAIDIIGPCEEVLVALRRIIRAIDLHSKKLEQRFGLTGPQLLVLKVIAKQDPVSTGVIAKQVNLSHATVTSILDRLEKRGFVARQKDSTDKRKMLITALDPAKEVIMQAPALLQDSFVAKYQQLAEWEQTQMLATLQRIAAMMDADTLDAAPFLTSVEFKSEAK